MAAVEPGKQYLGVLCKKCRQLAPFVEVETGTQLGDVGGEFEVECVHCGYTATYPATELRMMEAHQKH